MKIFSYNSVKRLKVKRLLICIANQKCVLKKENVII
jgi:hypothetical protein